MKTAIAILALLGFIGLTLYNSNTPLRGWVDGNILGTTDVKDYELIFNEYRQSQGCAPLVFTDDLINIATLRLAELQRDYSHNSLGGYIDYLAENAMKGIFNNEDALQAWQTSPEHNANMIDPTYKNTGYAIGGGYAVQVFSDLDTVNGIPQLPPGWHFVK